LLILGILIALVVNDWIDSPPAALDIP